MTFDEVWPVLMRPRGDSSPLYEPEDAGAGEDLTTFAWSIQLDDVRLDLPTDLADALRSWSLAHRPEGFASRTDLRTHVRQGRTAAQRLARHLGPSCAVRYWDGDLRSAKWVCWGCDRLHWERDDHGTPAHPLDITVEGEFKFGPLRSDGFGDFFPDDPAAALSLSDGLVAALNTWAQNIDITVNLDLKHREEGRYASEWQRLFHEGTRLAERTARELGPTRTVTYKGLANGGLAVLTSVTWRGERKLQPREEQVRGWSGWR